MPIYSLVDCNGIPLQHKLDSLFNSKEKGFFIELGAHDGLSQSNTAFLEFERNWTGVLIEPSVTAFEKCKSSRPNSTCFNAACVSNTYQREYITGDFDGVTMASVNGIRLNRTSLVSVKALTLESILDNINPLNIDLLSLDTEGYELPILEGLNLNKYRPNYMIIEIYREDFDKTTEYLTKNNYILIENITNYNTTTNPLWDGTHNDYLFKDMNIN
jgi:FkbM family methyltransferase